MNVPGNIIIRFGAFATDGGSIHIQIEGTDGEKHYLLLSQHRLPPSGMPGEKIPGRLYYDGALIDIRSEEESAIISALKTAEFNPPVSDNPPKEKQATSTSSGQAGMIVGDDIKDYYSKIKKGPAAALRHLAEQVIEFVESEEYEKKSNNPINSR